MSFNEQLIINQSALLNILNGSEAEWTYAYGTSYHIDSDYFHNRSIQALTTDFMNTNSNFVRAISITTEIINSSSLGFRISFTNQNDPLTIRTIILCASVSNGSYASTNVPVLAVGISVEEAETEGLYIPSSKEPQSKVVLALNLSFPTNSNLEGVTTISADSVTEEFVKSYVDNTLGNGFVTLDTDQTIDGKKVFSSDLTVQTAHIGTLRSSTSDSFIGYPLTLVDKGSNKVGVIRKIQELYGYSLSTANDIVSSAPILLYTYETRESALDAYNALMSVGASCSIATDKVIDTYDVVLLSYSNLTITLTHIRNLLDVSLAVAKNYIANIPTTLISYETREEAEICLRDLEAIGAVARIDHTEEEPISLMSDIKPKASKEISLGSVDVPFKSISTETLNVSNIKGISEDGVSLEIKSIKSDTIHTSGIKPYVKVKFKVCSPIIWNEMMPEEFQVDSNNQQDIERVLENTYDVDILNMSPEVYYRRLLRLNLVSSQEECYTLQPPVIDIYYNEENPTTLLTDQIGSYDKSVNITPSQIFNRNVMLDFNDFISGTLNVDLSLNSTLNRDMTLLKLEPKSVFPYSIAHRYSLTENLNQKRFHIKECVFDDSLGNISISNEKIYACDSNDNISITETINATLVSINANQTVFSGKVSFSDITGFAPTSYTSVSSEMEVPVGCNVMLYTTEEVLVGQTLNNCYIAIIKNGSVARGQKIKGTFTALSQGQLGVPCAVLAVCKSL